MIRWVVALTSSSAKGSDEVLMKVIDSLGPNSTPKSVFDRDDDCKGDSKDGYVFI